MCCSPHKPGGYAAATGSCATTTVRGGRTGDAAGQSCPAAVQWGLVHAVVCAGQAAAKLDFELDAHWMAAMIAHSRPIYILFIFLPAGDLVMDVYLRRMLWRFRRHGKGAYAWVGLGWFSRAF